MRKFIKQGVDNSRAELAKLYHLWHQPIIRFILSADL